MPKKFENRDEQLKDIYEQLADLRGEALAGRLVAGFAVEILARQSDNPEKLAESLEHYIDNSFNSLVQHSGDEAMNQKTKEVGRLRAQEFSTYLRRQMRK